MTVSPSAAAPSTDTATPLLRLRNVSVVLGDRLALEDVSFDLPAGPTVGLIGPNGSGKSTLLRALLGILPLASGSIEVAGGPPSAARDLFAYLPQRREIELNLPLRASEVVLMGRLRRTGWLRAPSKQDREIAAAALERVGLAERRHSTIGEMSFGQQQRVLFARMLAQDGRIVLLDEPMNGVDPRTQELFLQILASFREEGRTVIMATHDLDQAASHCNYLCVLNRRLVAFGPTADVLTPEVLRDAYGLHLHIMHGDERGHEHVDHVVETMLHPDETRRD